MMFIDEATAVAGSTELECLSTMQIVLKCCRDGSHLNSHTKTK